jgi:hypothetical protein
MSKQDANRIVPSKTLNDYFHHAIRRASRKNNLPIDDATLHYLTLLLGSYARSEELFDYADQRLQLRPLAIIYDEALNASCERERRLWLQRLGDIALFVGGLFSGRLSRRYQDLDYCIAMGCNAYGYLHETTIRRDQQAQAAIFGRLSNSFDRFVDVVATVTRPPVEHIEAAGPP